MIYYLAQYIREASVGTEWEEMCKPLRVLSYITFRSAGAAVTALLISLVFGPRMIAWLKRVKFGQNYADHAEASGIDQRGNSKRGTPTMGGLLIVVSMDVSGLLWAQWNELVILTLLSLIVLSGLGFYDDYAKITKASRGGASSTVKLTVQMSLALFIGLYLWMVPHTSKLITEIMIPIIKGPVFEGAAALGLLLCVLTIVGSSNAVNLTDGLDGLAIGCTLIVTSVFLVLTYVAGNVNFSNYLQVPHVPGAGELTVFCSAMFGAGLGFLWFNCHPAQVFMGDTGSLALGGALGIMAVLIHQPFVLFIAGGVFVWEAVSVILQRGWFKYTRRTRGTGERLFLMAPAHHHFEKKGWSESKVVTRFYILCVLCAVVALSTLKLR